MKFVFNPFTGTFDALNSSSGTQTAIQTSNGAGGFQGNANAVVDLSGNANFGGNLIIGEFLDGAGGGRIQLSSINSGEAQITSDIEGNCGFNCVGLNGGIIGANAGSGGPAYQMNFTGNILQYYNLTKVSFNSSFQSGNTLSFGIGTFSPGYLLDVAGDINSQGAFRASGVAGITGTMTTASLVGKTLIFNKGIITGFA